MLVNNMLWITFINISIGNVGTEFALYFIVWNISQEKFEGSG